MNKEQDKNLLWYNLAMMAFVSVWGFGNVVNNFANQGLKVVVSWVLIIALYFVPYALMVGELGSAFKNHGGGVSSWIGETINHKIAYFAGWTYWIVHMPYLSQKPNSFMIASSWAIFQDGRISQMNPVLLQVSCLIVFVIALYIAGKGINPLKKLSSLAGSSMFIMSMLFILLMIAAPAITNVQLNQIDWSWSTFMPKFDGAFFTSISILVFAVGGCEKISPYVNQMKDPAKGFSRGMIALAVMVAVTAILGTISLGLMIDSNNIPGDLMTNGAYYAFQKLGEYYKVGNIFVILYAITNMIGQFAVLIISIDAPLRMLLNSGDRKYIPEKLFVRNKNGAYVNGHKLIFIIVSILIIVPAMGIGSVDELVRWLVKLNAVCMPLRYLWVFVAYIALKRTGDKFEREYYFVKNKTLGIIIGVWCFAFTTFACVGGMYSEDKFQLILNIATPFILILLGFILPQFAKKNKAVVTSKDEVSA